MFRRLGGDCGRPLVSILEITFGLACVDGDTMGRMMVGSKPCSWKRRENRVSAGSSGKRSLIRFSSFTI